MRNRKTLNALAAVFSTVIYGCHAQGVESPVILHSPDNEVTVKISTTDGVSYEVMLNNKQVVSESYIDLIIEGFPGFSQQAKLIDVSSTTVNQELVPEVKVKSSKINDSYEQVTLTFSNHYAVEFRAYDNGVAYRFVTRFDKPIKVMNEVAEFNFSEQATVYYPLEEGFYSHNERSYLHQEIGTISVSDLASTPTLVDTGTAKVLITETALFDYAGMWLLGDGKDGLQATFPQVPTKVVDGELEWIDRNQPVVERADFIAQTQGAREFPWRVLAIAEDDTELLTNQLTYQLAIPNKIDDPSWVKPGKVAWDWYNANNLKGVDFEAGLNTETYKYYIDFASENGIEYVILDEGWYPLGDLMGSVPGFDVPEIMAYAKQKNVGIILWTTWLTLEQQFDEAMDRFVELGAVGIKPDFFQRDDQEMVNFYWKIAEEAAKRKLLVDFHGAYKPAGLRRTYPNVISREGVKGLEWNKWSYDSTPEHNTTLPFIRMVAGPMDYTPGAMANAVGPAAFEKIKYKGKEDNHQDFTIRFNRPMSQTTRVHQMAMFTVFESPLQMMADSPSQYMDNMECAEFIASVPSVWDDSIALNGKIGDYVTFARRSGKDWFIGSMSDEQAREFTIDLDFLPKGSYDITIFEDGVNAHRFAEDYKTTSKTVTNKDSLTIRLAPGGGYTAKISPSV